MKRAEQIKELQKLGLEELLEKERALSEELMKLRFRKTSGQLEEGHLLGQIRKQIARVKTYITQAKKAAA